MDVEEFDTSACMDLRDCIPYHDVSYEWDKTLWIECLSTIEIAGIDIPVVLATHKSMATSDKFSGYAVILNSFCQGLMEAHINFVRESCKLRRHLAPEKRSDFTKKNSQVISVITSLIKLVEKEIPSKPAGDDKCL